MNGIDPRTKVLLASPHGFDSRLWGPGLWKFVHYIALNYPATPTKGQIASYHAFFLSLCNILPCGVCRAEFCKLVTNPKSRFYLRRSLFAPTPKSPAIARHRLFTWTSELHNAVNRRLRKPTTSSRKWLITFLKTRKM